MREFVRSASPRGFPRSSGPAPGSYPDFRAMSVRAGARGPVLTGRSADRAAVRAGAAARADLVGVLGFTATLVGFLVFALSLSTAVAWWALPVVVAGAALFLCWQRRAGEPFIDVRLLVARPALLGTYAQFVVFNIVFYGAFYGLPAWLGSSRGFRADESGFLVLPLAGVGAVATVLASRVIARFSAGRALLAEFAFLVLGCLGVLALSGRTPVAVVVLVGPCWGFRTGSPTSVCRRGRTSLRRRARRVWRPGCVPDVPLPLGDPVHFGARRRVRDRDRRRR